MKLLKFLTNNVFSHFDLFFFCVAWYCFTYAMWLGGLVTLLAGSFASALLNQWVTQRKRELFWQEAADTGDRVRAIKHHRAVYGSSLMEAVNAVDNYLSNRSNQ